MESHSADGPSLSHAPGNRATKVVVLGAGYGGLTCALRLGRRLKDEARSGKVDLHLVDRHPYHLLETRLHEAAARGTEVTIPLSQILAGRPVRFTQASITGLDMAARCVLTDAGEVPFDILVIALGANSFDFGIPGVQEHAFELKTLDDALELRAHMEERFSAAESESDIGTQNWLRRVVIGGAGLTGVELATELAERVEDLTDRDLGVSGGGEIVLVEAADRILPGSDPSLGKRSEEALRKAGIRLLTGTRLERIRSDAVELSTGEVLKAGTIAWTAGVRASKLLETPGLTTASQGRVVVDRTLKAESVEGVYVIGDAAYAVDPDTGDPVPMAAQFALQQGRRAADNIVARLRGKPEEPYEPKVLGEVISLGRHLATGWFALGWIGRLRMTGFLASLLKRAIQERHLVLLWRESRQWARPGGA